VTRAEKSARWVARNRAWLASRTVQQLRARWWGAWHANDMVALHAVEAWARVRRIALHEEG
jgi:hypothetical protein